MNNFVEYDLIPDPGLDATENMLIVGIYIREEVRTNSSFTLQIPKFVYENLSKTDFNVYFSDLLLDASFLDRNIKIEIKDASFFRLIIH